MNSFEEFSKEIDTLVQSHKKSRLARLRLWLEYRRRLLDNKPLLFPINEEGEEVGKPMDIYHITLHDMFEHVARGQLTAEVLLKGRRINAFSVGAFERVGTTCGKYTIQPRWV